MLEYDIIVIGAGPAGISACLYAKRANMKVLNLYYGTSELEKANKIENYYGFPNGITGKELYINGINQAKNMGIDVIEKEITDIEITKNFTYIVKSLNEMYETKSIIIATGNKKVKPNIEGINALEGKGISYCGICDGFFYKNKNIVVIGNGKFALSEANFLRDIVNNIKILTNGADMIDINEFDVDTRKIKRIYGEKKVQFIEFEDGEKIWVDGVFIAEGIAGGNDFAKRLGIITQNDNIIVNENMQTNVKGIFACGNLTGGLLQINKAAYEGAIAGLQATNFVKNKN